MPNLLEYEAKHVLAGFDISVPQSRTINSPSDADNLTLPIVLKSQVPVGGRGKNGGIVIVDEPDKLKKNIGELLSLPIKGHAPRTLLAEEKLSIELELYLSILVERETSKIVFLASQNGGVEIESQPSSAFLRLYLGTKPDFDSIGQQLADFFNLADQTFALQELTQRLYGCFKANDALLIEINPLVLTEEQKLVAADCKMNLDDAAVFRHPEWLFEMPAANANFVTLNPHGTIATIANGAGLAMATVDAVEAAGLIPANFLDIGGGATEASVLRAFEAIMEYPDITAIVINIFAGITRCDEVARAVIAASQQIEQLPPLLIRLEGTNADEARSLLTEAGVSTFASLGSALMAAKESVS